MQIKFHSMWKNWNGNFKSKQKKFEEIWKQNYVVKDYIPMKVLNAWLWELIPTLVVNELPLNWVEPKLSFSKWE